MKKLPILCVVLAALFWGCISVFTKPLIAAGFNSMQVSFIRTGGAIIPAGLYMLIKDKSLFAIKLRHVPIFIGTGVVSLTFFSYCYINAITKCTPAVAAVLLYTAPAFVMILSKFIFKEKITLQKIIAILLTILGCALVSGLLGGTVKMSTIGIVYGVLSGFGYALYSIFARFGINKYNTITIIFYTFVFSTIASAPAVVGMDVTAIKLTGNVVVYLVTAGLATVAIPYLFYTLGLSKLENSTASIIATLEPVVATVVGVLVFHEDFSMVKLSGIAIVFFAVVFANIKLKLNKKGV